MNRRGVRPFPHPDVMLAYGSKDSLVKVASTDAGLEDTQAYLSVEAFRNQVTSARLINHSEGDFVTRVRAGPQSGYSAYHPICWSAGLNWNRQAFGT